jgi:thiol-disulfide isomerase/thioredoxin
MKTILLTSILAAGVSLADFETWTNKDGKAAELELVNVVDKDGGKAGEFKMRNGRTVTLMASDLSEESATRLNDWKSPAATAVAKPSVFDSILNGNLERLSGKRLKKCDQATKPAKYYVFYYTASWCPPCQAFTPSLVEWYKANKNDNFELVLITSDRDEKSMEQYAADKLMPWPQLKMRKVEDFKKNFQHGVSGIPSLIVCDLEGKNLGNFRSNLPGVTELVTD